MVEHFAPRCHSDQAWRTIYSYRHAGAAADHGHCIQNALLNRTDVRRTRQSIETRKGLVLDQDSVSGKIMREFLSMGGYGGYVWSAYFLCVVVLGGTVAFSISNLRSLLRTLRNSQQGPSD